MGTCEFAAFGSTRRSGDRSVPCGAETYGHERLCAYHAKVAAGLMADSLGEWHTRPARPKPDRRPAYEALMREARRERRVRTPARGA